jgi:proteasome lid subunit RPN8/RPN11
MEAVVLPSPTLRMNRALWRDVTAELHRRTEGRHESGAFLLGHRRGAEREATAVIYYDDLDPRAYDTGVCVLRADAFGHLWDSCADQSLMVVADAHVHPRGAWQSLSDRENPMIARPGHLALILPRMAAPPVRRGSVGLYEYLGDHRWRSHGGRHVAGGLKHEDRT